MGPSLRVMASAIVRKPLATTSQHGRAEGPSLSCGLRSILAVSAVGPPMAAFPSGNHNLGRWPFSESHAHERRYSSRSDSETRNEDAYRA
jgi:hypothetical protein